MIKIIEDCFLNLNDDIAKVSLEVAVLCLHTN